MQLQIDKLGKVAITVEESHWSLDKDYDRLTVVEAPNNEYKTYISRKPVPAGTVLTNREYWIPFSSLKEEIVIDFNSFVSSLTEAMQQTKDYTDGVINQGIEDITAIKEEAMRIITYIADNGIDSTVLAPNSINSEKIQANAVIAGKIAPNAVVAGNIAANAVIEGNIAPNAVIAGNIAPETVTGSNIAEKTIDATRIKDKTIAGINIKDRTIGTDQLSGGMYNGVMTPPCITTDKIADWQPDSEYETGVTTDKIADSAVTEAKIANRAVTADKLSGVNDAGGAAVTEDKLAPGAVTTEKLATPVITQLQTIMDTTPTPGSEKPVNSGGVFNSVISSGAFDLSAYTGDSYASLSAALTAMSALSAAYKKGGMSIKYVQSSDNNYVYVQYRLMKNQWSTTESDWQGIDAEPIAGSKSLVESGGVDKKISNELYTEESKNITWVTGLVADGIVIKSSNKDRMTNLFLLKRGETVKVKTKGDGSYWFNVISSISSSSSVAVNTPVTSIVVCNSISLKEYSYTAADDIYLTVCVFNNDTSEIRFENLPKDNKLELLENSVSAIQGQVGLTVDIQSLKKEILYDANGTWKTDSARYESIIIDNIPSDTLLIKVVNTTKLSFVSDLGGLTGTINYANGSSRITVDADSIYKIPSETRYIVIATNIAGTDCTPVSIEFLGVQQIYNNPLYGKKLAVDGDSICYGAGYLGGYAKIIGERNNMTVQNLGVGGGTLAVVSGKHNICTSMLNLDDDADYIIIEGGVNDSANGVTIGNFTAGYNNTLPNTTFYGAIETICKQLSYKFKGKKYGFLIPHQMSKPMNPAWGNPDLATGVFYDAILKACTKWGVPVLDLTKEVPPFNGFAYSGNADLIAVADAYTADTAETGHGDGWHPNEAGYKKYYCDKIEAWLKTL